MPPNLRCVVAQCYRLGGCRQTRNFSSANEAKGVGGRAEVESSSASIFTWIGYGFVGVLSGEVVGLVQYYRRAKVSMEELKPLKQRHDELRATLMRRLSME